VAREGEAILDITRSASFDKLNDLIAFVEKGT
jgi:hypothetical protein